jgi:hypothetical protein
MWLNNRINFRYGNFHTHVRLPFNSYVGEDGRLLAHSAEELFDINSMGIMPMVSDDDYDDMLAEIYGDEVPVSTGGGNIHSVAWVRRDRELTQEPDNGITPFAAAFAPLTASIVSNPDWTEHTITIPPQDNAMMRVYYEGSDYAHITKDNFRDLLTLRAPDGSIIPLTAENSALIVQDEDAFMHYFQKDNGEWLSYWDITGVEYEGQGFGVVSGLPTASGVEERHILIGLPKAAAGVYVLGTSEPPTEVELMDAHNPTSVENATAAAIENSDGTYSVDVTWGITNAKGGETVDIFIIKGDSEITTARTVSLEEHGKDMQMTLIAKA